MSPSILEVKYAYGQVQQETGGRDSSTRWSFRVEFLSELGLPHSILLIPGLQERENVILLLEFDNIETSLLNHVWRQNGED